MMDYNKDVLKIFTLATRMGRRIAELEAEVARLKGYLDLQGKTLVPSTKKILISAARIETVVGPGSVAPGSKVSVVSGKKPGALRAKHMTTSSNYFGVGRHNQSGRWRAQVGRKDVKFSKLFDDELDAAIFVQEKLGNTVEVERLRELIIKEKKKNILNHEGSRRKKTVIEPQKKHEVREVIGKKDSADDARHEKIAAVGIEEIKGAFNYRWECKGCGETYGGSVPEKCGKCQSRRFERIKVLTDPEEQLAKPEGRHNN